MKEFAQCHSLVQQDCILWKKITPVNCEGGTKTQAGHMRGQLNLLVFALKGRSHHFEFDLQVKTT